ncbi:hypothetical protein Patl1_00861 [Pistacia atlantica]|uniref:Uncharacterized protein n=1 Tax=Pistacia atlantica TaxID=434234 RepID=A0ACC1CCG6_9ROSI|nr:hypothetical protein Patl1_00861 [Pistacia atlantica]
MFNVQVLILWGRHLVKVEIKLDLVLSAEKELGIIAGLQDRVAQVYGGLVYMSFSICWMGSLGSFCCS